MNYQSQNFQFPESQQFQMPPSQNDQGGTSWGAGPSNWGAGQYSSNTQTVFKPSPNSGFQSYQPGNSQAGPSSSGTQQMFPGNQHFFTGTSQNPGYYTPNAPPLHLFDVPANVFAPDFYGSGQPARNITPFPMQNFSPFSNSSQHPVTNLGNVEGEDEEEEPLQQQPVPPRRSRRVRTDRTGCRTGGQR